MSHGQGPLVVGRMRYDALPMESSIDEIFRNLRDRGYTVTESFVEDGSIQVVVNNEPMSYRQLRLLHEGQATLEGIVAGNARRRILTP
jgi:hypothetical protein